MTESGSLLHARPCSICAGSHRPGGGPIPEPGCGLPLERVSLAELKEEASRGGRAIDGGAAFTPVRDDALLALVAVVEAVRYLPYMPCQVEQGDPTKCCIATGSAEPCGPCALGLALAQLQRQFNV